MTQEFKLIGLSAPMSFTCCNFGKEDIFWAKSGIPADRYRELFKWAKSDDDFWKQKLSVVVEHTGLTADGTPLNAVVIEVKIDSN